MQSCKGLPLIIFVISLCLIGCKKEQTTETEQSPVEIVVVSGANQKANVGTRLPKSIVIGVQYAGGVPISFADVNFETDDGTVIPTQTKTLQEGTAEVDWVLGKTSGRQTLKVIAKNQQGEQVASKRINATAIALITDPTGVYYGTAVFRQTGFIVDSSGDPIRFMPQFVSFNLKTQDNKVKGTVSLIQNDSVGPLPPGTKVSGLTWVIQVTGTLKGNKVHLLEKDKLGLIEVDGTLSANGKQMKGKIKRWPGSSNPDATTFNVAKAP
ncbi:hypothetical protein [Pedobacter immunditicola]|uniref:hypothetical protein n=1 Tax=Pedobacter immunditicola TaxID=3133440 RepID=UPI00309C7C07